MIATAAFIIGSSYEAVHRDDNEDIDAGAVMFGLAIFMAFDYLMVSAL